MELAQEFRGRDSSEAWDARGSHHRLISEKWWQGLPADIRQAILTAEAEARPIQRKADEEYNKSIEDEWLKRGKVITHPDIKPFQQVAETIYPQFYDKVGGKEIIDRVRKIGEEMK